MESPSESKISKENARKYLLTKTRSLVNKWIIKFDPMQTNTTNIEEGLEYLQ